MNTSLHKNIIIYLIIGTLQGFFLTPISAQQSQDSSLLAKLDVSVYAGIRLNQPFGEIRSNWTEHIENESIKLSDDYQLSLNVNPLFSLNLGMEGRLPINSKTFFIGGIKYSQRGYRLKANIDYADPEAQYDETYSFKRVQKIKTLEIPLGLQFNIHPKLSPYAMIFLGNIHRKASKTKESNSLNVVINGEHDEDWSSHYEKESESFDFLETRNYIGILLGARYNYSDLIFFDINAGMNSDSFKRETTLNSVSMELSIGYFIKK